MAIIRQPVKCLTCEQPHTLRIGMGQEESQRHSFPCRGCGENITIRMDIDYKSLATPVTPEENAVLIQEVAGAPIVNLDANFLIPPDAEGVDLSFFRLEQLHAQIRKAIERGTLVEMPSDSDSLSSRPLRRPDYKKEWAHIQRAWSLGSRGKVELADRLLRKETGALYKDRGIDSLPEWIWYFAQSVIGSDYNNRVNEALNSLRLVSPEPLMAQLQAWMVMPSTVERGQVYFGVLSEFFGAYEEFTQILFYVQNGVPRDGGLRATSIAFERIQMFYGNAFEAFTSLTELLAVLNNVQHGRTYDTFEVLTWDQYQKLDKASLLGPFSNNQPLIALCEEADSGLRNASHHRRLRFDAEGQTVSYRAGKGGAGAQVSLSYAEYLERCVRISFQVLSLLLVELALSRPLGRTFPA